jgi:hypothetical protein
MSRAEKLQAMEKILANFSRDGGEFESPAWHGEALREAERAFQAGDVHFTDWDEAKESIRKKSRRENSMPFRMHPFGPPTGAGFLC